MKRDMNKVIAQTDGTIPYGYQLTGDEWLQLAHHAAGGGDDTLDAIVEAFTYGFALGMRCQKRKNKKAPVKRQGRA